MNSLQLLKRDRCSSTVDLWTRCSSAYNNGCYVCNCGKRPVEAWNNKGLLSLRLRNYSDAIDAFSHAVKIKPNAPEVCYNM